MNPNAKAEGDANANPQTGHRVEEEEHRMHQSQATASGTSTYDAARKAAENPVPQVSPPVGFGHPPTTDDAVGDQAAPAYSTGNSAQVDDVTTLHLMRTET